MYSPESIDSVLEFSNFQNDYEFEHSLFNDIHITLESGADDKEDSLHLDTVSVSRESHIDVISANDSVHSSSNSKFLYVGHGEAANFNPTKVTNPSSGIERISPLNLLIPHEEENRKRYPIGDSNSKNAIAARDNRLKKKKYVAELEKTVKTLKTDNEIMSKELIENRNRLSVLESEVHYLKSVIANQTTLAAILKSVSKTPGISLSSSFGNNNKDTISRSSNETSIKSNKNKSSEIVSASSSKSYEINLRSRTNMKSNSPTNKGVQNMSAKEIVQCCKNKRRKVDVIHVTDSDDSSTDSDMEEINVTDNSSHHKVNNSSHVREDYGGVCLHVSGTKVSLEFCATCNMKSNADVSLDHSYSSHISK